MSVNGSQQEYGSKKDSESRLIGHDLIRSKSPSAFAVNNVAGSVRLSSHNQKRLDGLELVGLGASVTHQESNFEEDIQAEIEARVQPLLRRRAPLLRRQIVRVPGPAGRVQQLVKRLPTPEPDVIERVYVTVPQRDMVNLLIERPSTPLPQIQERTVVAPAPRPLISHQVVTVQPRQQYNNNLRGVAYQYQPIAPASVVPYQATAASIAPQYYTQSSSFYYGAQPQQNWGGSQAWGQQQSWQQPQQVWGQQQQAWQQPQQAWGGSQAWGQQQQSWQQPQQAWGQQAWWPQQQQQAWGQQAWSPQQQQQAWWPQQQQAWDQQQQGASRVLAPGFPGGY